MRKFGPFLSASKQSSVRAIIVNLWGVGRGCGDPVGSDEDHGRNEERSKTNGRISGS